LKLQLTLKWIEGRISARRRVLNLEWEGA